MIYREISENLKKISTRFPVVAVTGPRQSGKTTLIKDLFPDYSYFNLESPDTLAIAENDPASFIRQNSNRVIIDEIQKAGHLLSYIQAVCDERKEMGNFIISGSENLLLSRKISQSLAGRAAYATLYPLDLSELAGGGVNMDIMDLIFKGGFPAIYDRDIPPEQYLNQYIATYVERDVRQIMNIANLSAFRRFLMLAAGRVGQVINMSSLANDTGVSVPTIEGWISLLEASHLAFRLKPYYNNFGKRFIKSPKLYFTDTGLACRLLGITSAEDLKRHFLIGGLFENFCIMEVVKAISAKILTPDIFYYRQNEDKEVDLIIGTGGKLIPVEFKSSYTFSSGFAKGIENWFKLSGTPEEERVGYVVYNGRPAEAGGISYINPDGIKRLLS